MIIVRSPLRITLGGGGTDHPSYFREYEGFLISAAINKYVYVTLHQGFGDDLLIKYSKVERVKSLDEIEHPVFREVLKTMDINWRGLEINVMLDVPSRNQLGASSAFTTALLRALHVYAKRSIRTAEIAKMASDIQLEKLKEPIGAQDQYISALGGLRAFRFCRDNRVESWPITMSDETRANLEDSLALFYTGMPAKSLEIGQEQNERTLRSDEEMIANLHFVKDLGLRSLEALEGGYLSEFGKLMDQHWQRKRTRSKHITNAKIDEWYELGMLNGATGGKLLGAGGGGFLLFQTNDKPRLRRAMLGSGLKEVRFNFDFEGTRVVIQ
ncbi:D-glycero-alpha-D-manno-heptose-7-phosphate kinase [Rhizomicrobium palustre]|uniref:D-glycero-alpha-D-manno-heptose-7-phosphate kinase n=1 Tax=Rhizomicrobium palustre TaxID=189966 RepID=A0A846MV31_9PROT|nr:galactokinase [Rhizomicrobium palustre]NIK86930.1 D-glycero-alpha-D-manno-heptose-7-phosphate kinase [Rhizomicrobium palustre]